MNPNEPSPGNGKISGSSAEQIQLDEALGRADQLLVESLQLEDRRRGRRKLVLIAIGIGGFIMITTVCLLLLSTPAYQDETPVPNAKTAQVPKEVDSSREESISTSDLDPTKSAEVATEGWALWQRQQLVPAREKFKQATELNPDNANAWNGLGWSNFNLGNNSTAEEAFQRVIELEPKHPAALNGLGQIAFFERQYDKAEKYLLKAAPQAPAAWYGLAKLYLLQGEYRDATKWIQKIASTGDNDPAIERMLTAAKEKNLPDDLRQLIEPVEVSPQTRDVAKAWQLMNSGDAEIARELFESVLEKEPDTFGAINGMGWLSLSTGDLNEAKKYFQRALKVEPMAAGAMNGLARVLYAEDDIDGAMKIWKEMVDTIPGPHAGTMGLAEAYLQREEYKLAIPLLEELAESDPSNQQYKNQLELARKEGK